MKPHLGVEPNISVIRVSKEMDRLFNSARGSTVEQSLLYFDGLGAAAWCDFESQEDYSKSFGDQSLFWTAAELIKSHLDDTKLNKRKVELVGLGAGDGRREAALAQCLVNSYKDMHVHCHLIDKSYPLLLVSHAHWELAFSLSDRVTFQEHHADFHHLTQMADVFDAPETEKILRVGMMFGGTIGNLDNELRFIRDSLSAFKVGDLFLVDVMLGFGSPDKEQTIMKQDPRFTPNTNTWRNGLEHWLESTLRHYRVSRGSVRFENKLSRTTSPIPNTYTVEIYGMVDAEQQKQARFNMLRLHRYDQESFIAAFAQEGWRRVGGRTFGYHNKRLWYLFVKE